MDALDLLTLIAFPTLFFLALLVLSLIARLFGVRV